MRKLLLLWLLCAACGGGAPDPAPTVAMAEPIRGVFTLEREDFQVRVQSPTRIEEGALALTAADGRGALRLDGGGWILMDRETQVAASLDGIELKAGRVWIDARDTEVTVRTEAGEIRAVDATFAVERGDVTRAYCGSGELSFVAGERDGRVAQGEELTLGETPAVQPATLWDDWTGGLANPTPRREAVVGYVGILAGRGLAEVGRARRPLAIRAHEVEANIEGDFASTEVIQTFFNAESAALEAEYHLRVPEGAVVHGFGVDLGGGFVDASVQPLASRGYALEWDDPTVATSRLSYDGPNRLRARVHPVQPGQTVRVRVRYAQWLSRQGERRTYAYPMNTEGASPARIGELRIRVNTDRAEVGVHRAGMGARTDGRSVVLRRSDWQPTSDFVLDLIDEEDEERPEGAAAYVVNAPAEPGADGDQRFVLFDVPTENIESEEDTEREGIDLVLLVDASGATDAEDLELARAIVESTLRQLSPEDRVTLRAGDVSARVPGGASAELELATDEVREGLLEALAHVDLGGATDLGSMLRGAAEVVGDSPRGVVLYVGDAVPTTGAMDTTRLRRGLATITHMPRWFGLAVGEGSNLDLLRALFDDERASRVDDRTEAARAVMRILAHAAAPMLRDVHVDLGPGVERVFPRPPLALPVGAPLRLVGRLRDELPTEIVVTGTRDGASFETTLTVSEATLNEQGDIRRRWANARLQELIDEDAGREALVELGVRFDLLTPWTSYVAVGGKVDGYWPVRGFDEDPRAIDWALGGGAAQRPREQDRSGWRRRLGAQAETETTASVVERTWMSRVSNGEEADTIVGDGGLGRASVAGALRRSERGPRACYERRLLVRPDLRGRVLVEVEVDGEGKVKDAKMVQGLDEADVNACILTEVRGVRFPATGSASVRVTHEFHFESAGRGLGIQRRCSDASRQSLAVRLNLWRERLAANQGSQGALSVWREASRQCELSSWRARRTLLRMLLRGVSSIDGQLALYRGLASDPSLATFLRSAILRNVRTPRDVALVRVALGIEAPLEWSVFSRLWKRAATPEAKLRLVRQWLEVVPDEMDLRLRLMALLEETNHLPEAKRVARELRADPLADARTRTAVGELWLRQGDEDEARRIFSEIVERAPYDPWARQRLGDLYRAHGWHDDAYREYRALSRLRPQDDGVLMLLARAAAGAGRIDEALRLEQRLSESVEPGHLEGVSAVARLWTTTRLAALKEDASGDELVRLRRRERRTGVLRDAPAVLITLTWPHPDEAPELEIGLPNAPEDEQWQHARVVATMYGLEGDVVRELAQDEPLRLRIRRNDLDGIRDWKAELTVIMGLGTPEERIIRQELTLDRQNRELEYELLGGALTARNAGNP